LIYFADLHVHSRFSRATSKECNIAELARWAALKGIRVVATGDFTHPGWRAEIRETLQEAEDGLFSIRKELLPDSDLLPGGFGPGDVRFILNVEISSIYKKGGKTRKVHNLVFMPGLEAMDEFCSRLDRVGNLKSDGRPILGLDSKHLLETALETTPESFVVPAHVWTPWFSILGSRSGFDSVEECFDDLTPHVFALETGLSSDPEMNRRVRSLDRYTLVSNSDTHSPANLGREVNIFQGRRGYGAIRDALRNGGGSRPLIPDAGSPLEALGVRSMSGDDGPAGADAFLGTLEFFPEEGKYHLDGHRKCSARLQPEETERLSGKCPACGQPVTVGVMNRVIELADRPPGETPDESVNFWRMIPLAEIIAQGLGVGTKTKQVSALYFDLLHKLGPELMILWAAPMDQIAARAPRIVTEGVERARLGQVHIEGGYDGEYGRVRLFTADERRLYAGQESFLPVEGVEPKRKSGAPPGRKRKRETAGTAADPDADSHAGPNEEQDDAVLCVGRPVLVRAGPGAGKTRTLTRRIAWLLETGQAKPDEIIAVTFTRKAAKEMRERVIQLLSPEAARGTWIGTFHQLGAKIIDAYSRRGGYPKRGKILDPDEAKSAFRTAVKEAGLDASGSAVGSLHSRVSLLKQALEGPEDAAEHDLIAAAFRAYEAYLEQISAYDMDDLLARSVRILNGDESFARYIREAWARRLLVDEFQDVNRAQYEMVRILAGEEGSGLFVIGDPDQAIYGFRGSDRRYFGRFREDYPQAWQVHLKRNYRSHAAILSAAEFVLGAASTGGSMVAQRAGGRAVKIVGLPSPAAEGNFIVRTIDSMIGGARFESASSRESWPGSGSELGFRDFAVLYRLNAVGDAIEDAFQASGIPFRRSKKSTPEEEAEAYDPRAEAVTLMTMHASKGLEFPAVFVAGCEDGIVPHTFSRASGWEVDVEEERRLLYVAMTRAENDLFLTRARTRVIFGRTLNTQVSRFLLDAPCPPFEALAPLPARPVKSEGDAVQCDLFG
jgi:DNA helicase-2/ATP-dependent DNA helicase PcrA